MAHAALAPLIGPEFDEFLGASIGEDRNGTSLSVLSALARLDVDPWQEAASLGRMSGEAAAGRLTALIDALPYERASAVPSKAIAADLVALLPKSKRLNVTSQDNGLAVVNARQAADTHRIVCSHRIDCHRPRSLGQSLARIWRQRRAVSACCCRRHHGYAAQA